MGMAPGPPLAGMGPVSPMSGKISELMSSAESSCFAWRSSLDVCVEAIGEDAEELPEHFDGELVLFAEDVEEIRAADGDELRGAFGFDGRATRHASNERHLADVLALPEVRERLRRRGHAT